MSGARGTPIGAIDALRYAAAVTFVMTRNLIRRALGFNNQIWMDSDWPDRLHRMSLVLGIYAALHTLFPDQHHLDSWIRRPSAGALFRGEPALALKRTGRLSERGRQRLHEQHHIQILGGPHLLLLFLHHGDSRNAANDHEPVQEFGEPLAELARAGEPLVPDSSVAPQWAGTPVETYRARAGSSGSSERTADCQAQRNPPETR